MGDRGAIHPIEPVDIKPLEDWYQVSPTAENFAGPADGDARDFRVCRTVCCGASDVSLALTSWQRCAP